MQRSGEAEPAYAQTPCRKPVTRQTPEQHCEGEPVTGLHDAPGHAPPVRQGRQESLQHLKPVVAQHVAVAPVPQVPVLGGHSHWQVSWLTTLPPVHVGTHRSLPAQNTKPGGHAQWKSTHTPLQHSAFERQLSLKSRHRALWSATARLPPISDSAPAAALAAIPRRNARRDAPAAKDLARLSNR